MAEEVLEEVLEEEDTQKGKFMTFRTGSEYYGISISYVNEIIVMQPITAIPEAENYIKGLIVEEIAEVDTIMDSDIMPPPTLGHKGKEQNKYVYGLAKTGDTVKLLLDPERLIEDAAIEIPGGENQEEEQ